MVGTTEAQRITAEAVAALRIGGYETAKAKLEYVIANFDGDEKVHAYLERMRAAAQAKTQDA